MYGLYKLQNGRTGIKTARATRGRPGRGDADGVRSVRRGGQFRSLPRPPREERLDRLEPFDDRLRDGAERVRGLDRPEERAFEREEERARWADRWRSGVDGWERTVRSRLWLRLRAFGCTRRGGVRCSTRRFSTRRFSTRRWVARSVSRRSTVRRG